MIETKQMTEDDFKEIMTLNKGIYPEYDNLSEDDKWLAANFNINTGTAESFFEDDRLVAVGGIRYVGLGEAWMITPPDIRLKRAKSLLREVRNIFVKTRDEKKLLRIFAQSKISVNFLKHLGFEESEMVHIWARK